MKTLIIDAIVGAGFPTLALAIQFEKTGLAYYSGLQGNPDWTWCRDKLEALILPELKTIYEGLRASRDAVETPQPGCPTLAYSAAAH